MPLVSSSRPSVVVPPTVLALAAMLATSLPARAQCPTEPTLQVYNGAGSVVCPCFVPGEQAGVVFNAPADHYPIEILRIGVGWGSAVGGSPDALEDALHIYPAGLPTPGAPLFSLNGPQLVDGFINEFDIAAQPGEVVVNSGPFMVALEFANGNAGDPFAGTVVHDGNNCQANRNSIFAVPGGWMSACAAGVTGDWLFHVVYRRVECNVDVEHELFPDGTVATLYAARPNPARGGTELDYVVPQGGLVSIAVFDVHGRYVRELASGWRPAGRHNVRWDGADATGTRAPAGMYVVKLSAGSERSARKVTLTD